MGLPTSDLIDKQNSTITQGEIYYYDSSLGTWVLPPNIFTSGNTTTNKNSRYLPYTHWRLNDLSNAENGYWSNSGYQGGKAISGTVPPSTGTTGLFYSCAKWDTNTNSLEYTPETRTFDSLTISFWIKCDYTTLSGDFDIFDLQDNGGKHDLRIYYRDGVGIVMTSENTIISSDITVSDTELKDDEWTFFGLSLFNTSNEYILVYDKFHSGGTITTVNFSLTDTDTLYIGNGSSRASLDLYIQDLRIYDVGLTYSELMSLNNQGHGTFNGLYKYQTLRDSHHWYKLMDHTNDCFSDSGYLSSYLRTEGGSSSNVSQTKDNRVCGYFNGNYGYNILSNIQTTPTTNQYSNYYTTGFTISLWVYEESSASEQFWVTNSSGVTSNTIFRLGENSEGYIEGFIDDKVADYAASGGTSWKNTWTYVVLIYDSENEKLKLYIDGVIIDTNTEVKETFIFDDKIIIGSDGALGSPCDSTYLKDIRLYNYDLSEDEIYILYNNGLGLEF